MDENVILGKILLIEDFNKICRCCLSVNPLGSIFEIMYEGTPLDSIFFSLFGVQLDRKDDLPKKICEICVGKLICCYIFKKRYEAAEVALRNVIQIKIEIESPEAELKQPEDNIEEPQETRQNETIQNLKQSETSIKVQENLEAKVNNENEICSIMKRTLEPKINTLKKPSLKFTCSCGEIFMSRLEFRQHRDLTGHQLPRTHPCKICGKFFSKYKLRVHSRIHDGVKRYSCNYCTMRFAASGNLQRHMMQHTGERPYLCEFCGKGFIQHDSLAAHRRVHTGEKPYLCSICGKGFRDKSTCKVHIRSHNGERPSATKKKKPMKTDPTKKDSTITFVCDECGRSFSKLFAYKLHLNKHGLNKEQIIENDKQCHICKKFYASHSLYFHMMVHKKEKQFLCNVCGKGFCRKGALASHIVSHTGEKSLACEFCDKKFARQHSLRIHQYDHTGERPHACPSCPKKFKQSAHLASHLKVHTGEKPYMCKFCDKSFSHKYTLDVHIRTHTGEKPYQCDICTDVFHDAGALKKHKKRKHPDLNLAPRL